MTGADTLDLARDAIWLLIQLSAPMMIAGLVVGIVIAVLQALTQIQEMTLTFVPKMLVILVSLMVFLPFMLATLMSFTESLMGRIVSG